VQTPSPTIETIETTDLAIAVETYGPHGGDTVVLMHGFPDDVRAYDQVVGPLVADGMRVLVPYLRGFGPTRFLDPAAPRMAQQAAIGEDLFQLLEATGTDQAILAGYDWGGRAACITAIMHPERVKGLVSITGYNVKIGRLPAPPKDPKQLQALWYQWLFGTKPGRLALEENREALCEAMWRWWSPTWQFTPEQFNTTAQSFHNPDFVDCVIQRVIRGLTRSKRTWQLNRRLRCQASFCTALTTGWRRLQVHATMAHCFRPERPASKSKTRAISCRGNAPTVLSRRSARWCSSPSSRPFWLADGADFR
jgi:pimeloyl-ACP methyl ester carboxylesterase